MDMRIIYGVIVIFVLSVIYKIFFHTDIYVKQCQVCRKNRHMTDIKIFKILKIAHDKEVYIAICEKCAKKNKLEGWDDTVDFLDVQK